MNNITFQLFKFYFILFLFRNQIPIHFVLFVYYRGSIVICTKNYNIGAKPRTHQGKQIIRNASLNLIQDWKHKDAR